MFECEFCKKGCDDVIKDFRGWEVVCSVSADAKCKKFDMVSKKKLFQKIVELDKKNKSLQKTLTDLERDHEKTYAMLNETEDLLLEEKKKTSNVIEWAILDGAEALLNDIKERSLDPKTITLSMKKDNDDGYSLLVGGKKMKKSKDDATKNELGCHWRLLEEGEEIKAGDQGYDSVLKRWISAFGVYNCIVTPDDPQFRRKVHSGYKDEVNGSESTWSEFVKGAKELVSKCEKKLADVHLDLHQGFHVLYKNVMTQAGEIAEGEYTFYAFGKVFDSEVMSDRNGRKYFLHPDGEKSYDWRSVVKIEDIERSIDDEIFDAIEEYIDLHGKRPEYLYVGRREYELMVYNYNVTYGILSYNGLKVCRIDRNEFLKVSVNPLYLSIKC